MMTSSDNISSDDRCRALCSIISKDLCGAVCIVFNWGSEKPPGETFGDYIKGEAGEKEYKKIRGYVRVNLDKYTNAEDLDITNMIECIPWVCKEVEKKKEANQNWKLDSLKYELEGYLEQCGEIRNVFFHSSSKFSMDANDFNERTEEIEELIENMITKAGDKYTKGKGEVNKIIKDMHSNIRKKKENPQTVLTMQKKWEEKLKEMYCNKSTITFASLVKECNLAIQVNEVYTQLRFVLHGSSTEIDNAEILQCFDYETYLNGPDPDKKKKVLLIEGSPGSGKSRFAGIIMYNWTNKKDDIKDLDSYGCVVYIDRENPYDRMRYVPHRLCLRSLVIVDDHDDMNSLWLLSSLLNRENDTYLDVLVLTRPEMVGAFHERFEDEYEIVDLKIEGLSKPNKEDFLYKAAERFCKPDKTDVLDCLYGVLEEKEFRFDLPFYLVMASLLRVYQHDMLDLGTKHHVAILRLVITKIALRLMDNNKSTSKDDETAGMEKAEKAIRQFMYTLSEESFESLYKSNGKLTDDSHKTLEAVCKSLDLEPKNDILGELLVFINHWKDTTIYPSLEFAHESQRHLYAALFLYHDMKGGNKKTVRDLINFLNSNYKDSDKVNPKMIKEIHDKYPCTELKLPEWTPGQPNGSEDMAAETFRKVEEMLQEKSVGKDRWNEFRETVIHLLVCDSNISSKHVEELQKLDMGQWSKLSTSKNSDEKAAKLLSCNGFDTHNNLI